MRFSLSERRRLWKVQALSTANVLGVEADLSGPNL